MKRHEAKSKSLTPTSDLEAGASALSRVDSRLTSSMSAGSQRLVGFERPSDSAYELSSDQEDHEVQEE